MAENHEERDDSRISVSVEEFRRDPVQVVRRALAAPVAVVSGQGATQLVISCPQLEPDSFR